MKPWGRFHATDVHRAGGVALVARELAKRGLVHGELPTVDGRTLDEVATAVEEAPGQEVVHPIENPIKPSGSLRILRGNLAPEGCVVKLTVDHALHRGPARVFDNEQDAFAAVKAKADPARRRGRDPLRGPGRRSRHARDAPGHRGDHRRGARRLGRAGHRRPLLRAPPTASWSATSPPRRSAAARSPRSQEGDTVTIDVEAGELRVELSDDEIAERLAPLGAAAATLYRRRPRQVCRPGLVGQRGRGHVRVSLGRDQEEHAEAPRPPGRSGARSRRGRSGRGRRRPGRSRRPG